MKKIIFILLIIGLESCSSQKKVETTNEYFSTASSSIQEHIGGRAESGSTFKLKISLVNQPEEVSFDSIYFRKQVLPCVLKKEGDLYYLLAEYNNESSSSEDKATKFPFELISTEAVIGYTKENQPSKYLKVTGIKEKLPLAFPSKPRN